MRKVIEFPAMPPELQLKRVVACTADDNGPGFHLTYECGHTVWCAVPFDPGQRLHCGRCIDLFHQKALSR